MSFWFGVSSPLLPLARWLAGTGSILLCLAIPPLLVQAIERANYNPHAADLSAFHSGWERTASFVEWQPHYLPAQAELDHSYARDNHRINLIIKYYRNQTHAAQLISSSNKMNVDDSKTWVNNTQSDLIENLTRSGTTRPISIHETQLSNATQHLLIWSMDWINGQFNNSHIAGKMIQTFNKLRLAGDDGAAVIICAPFSENPEEARAAMRSFLSTDFDAIETVLNTNRKR